MVDDGSHADALSRKMTQALNGPTMSA